MTVWLLLARLGSKVAAVTSAVLTTVVPLGVLGDTRTTTVKFAETPEASVAIVALIVPVPPAVGLVKLNAGPDVCHPRRTSCWPARRPTVPPSGHRSGRRSRP